MAVARRIRRQGPLLCEIPHQFGRGAEDETGASRSLADLERTQAGQAGCRESLAFSGRLPVDCFKDS